MSQSNPHARVAPPPGLQSVARRLLATDGSFAPAAARVVLALVMLPHGLQKTVGLFGGHGFAGTMSFFTTSVGLPYLVALLVVALESLGAVALLVGAASRVMAAGFVALMGGAIVTSHAQHGFFMNWFGQQQGEGFEYHLLAIGLALVVAIAGGGAASVDRSLTRG